MADDLLTTLYLATTARLFVAPAMNQQMWKASATQRNIATLQEDGVTFIGPASGEQACGDVGSGRMVEPVDIANALDENEDKSSELALALTSLAGKQITITAGPTREPLDPVRYISNHSSGKMGFAIAQAAAQAGANVTLIAGPVTLSAPALCNRIDVTTADEMLKACEKLVPSTDIFISTAAVADYRACSVRTIN